MDRREFLSSSALALAGASALTALGADDAQAEAIFGTGREEREALAKGWLSPSEIAEHFPAYFPPDDALTPLVMRSSPSGRSPLHLVSEAGESDKKTIDKNVYRMDQSGRLLDFDGRLLNDYEQKKPRDYTDTASQFLIYQLQQNEDGTFLRSPHQVDLPRLDADTKTKTQLAIRMDTLHIGENEAEDMKSETKATMRFTVGEDMALAKDLRAEAVHWTVSAGLEFYEQLKDRKKNPQAPLRADFTKSMAGNSATLNDGLGKVQFQVLKHRRPEWWQQVFNFVAGDVGRKLISTLGFPSVTVEAVNYISSLVSTIGGQRAQPMFRSLPLRLAFHQTAQNSYVRRDASTGAVQLGGLTSGLWVLTRASSIDQLQRGKAFYDAYLGRLVPGNEREAVLSGRYFNDDFRDVSYAILDVRVETGLDKNSTVA